jgi:hypothetical protein
VKHAKGKSPVENKCSISVELTEDMFQQDIKMLEEEDLNELDIDSVSEKSFYSDLENENENEDDEEY